MNPHDSITLALWILALPLAGFVAQLALGRRLPRQGDWLATGTVGLGAVLAWRLFLPVLTAEGGHGIPTAVARRDWLALGSGPEALTIPFGVLVDNLTAVMLVVVTTVSFLVHLYSCGYMRDHHGHPEQDYARFFAYLQLFTFSMLGLCITDSLFFLFVFWELVGVCSYFLIGFYYFKPSAAHASMKAFLTTRVGDLGFFLAICIIWQVAGSFAYSDVFASVREGRWAGLTLAGLPLLPLAGVLLFLGPVGKSGQFPLHVWLPDAMEGPTPVSALIHAATMVAAGVYLVARMFPFFAGEAYWSGVAFDSPALWVVAGVGGFTALFAATIALVQHDIKKVLAYSTVSQLGYMMLGIGTGSFAAGMFHLWTHAFFKALLFLGSGSVIHAVGSNDMRVMGGLARRMPVTFFTFLVGTLAIAGVPWLFSGFYSKESILIQAFAFGRYWGAHGAPLAPMAMLPFVLAALAAGLTAFYMFRVVFLTFAGRPRDTHRHAHAHESAWTMTVPLAVLAAFSVAAAGFLGGHHWFAHRVNDVVTVEQYLAVAGEADGPGHWVLPEASFVEVVHAGHRVREPVPSSWATPEGTREARDFAERRLGAEGPVTWLSIAVALGGIALSWLVFAGPLAGRDLIGQAGALAACRRLLENLYYVDWFYYRVVIGAVHVLRLFLGGFDRYVVDGLVNLWGWTLRVVARLSGWADHAGVDGAVRGTSGAVLLLGGSARRLQTGRLQDYLYLTVFLGVMVFGVILMSRHLFSGNLL